MSTMNEMVVFDIQYVQLLIVCVKVVGTACSGNSAEKTTYGVLIISWAVDKPLLSKQGCQL